MNDIRTHEGALLGSLTATGEGFASIAHLIDPIDFIDAHHARLFRLIAARAVDGLPYDAVTLRDDSPEVGALALDLANNAAWSPRNLEHYAQAIATAAHSRRLCAAGATISHTEGITYEAALRLVTDCAPRDIGAIVPLRDAMRDVLADVQARLDAPSLPGVTTGLRDLDSVTSGLQPNDLLILAARPSVGKTAFGGQVALAAAKAGHRVLFFSVEMPPQAIAARALAHEASVDVSGFRDPVRFTVADHKRMFNARTAMAALPFDIVKGSGHTVAAVGALARQRHAVATLGLIVIDYLTLLSPPKAATTNDAVQLMTRALKRLAVELNVPVLLLSQLNRAADGVAPTLANLRDSGAIEQDADVVMLMHCTANGGVVLNIAKHRNGECRRLGLLADMAHMTFTEVDIAVVDPPKAQGALPRFDGAGTTAAAYRTEDER